MIHAPAETLGEFRYPKIERGGRIRPPQGTTMKPIPLVRQVTMAPAVSYLAAEGVPVHRYLQQAGLSTPSPSTLETLIPVHQVCEFLSSVARAEGINDLGFRVCGQQGTELLGTYGRLLSQSLTIHDLIETTLEFMSSYNSGLQIWVEHHQDQVRFCQKFVDSLPSDLTTEAVHLGLATAMACTKFACSADWRPERIELSTDPIDLTAYFPGFTDMPVAFNQPHTSIWLDRKMLSTPLPRSDSSSTSTMNQEDPAVDF